MPTCTRLILIAAATALLTGCHTTPTPTSLGPPYEPARAARAAELLPLQAMAKRRAGRVRVTDQQGVGHEVTSSTQRMSPRARRGNRPGAEGWRLSEAGFWTVDVVRETSGDVSILREVEQLESRRVEYDPPLPLLPAELQMDQPIQRVSRVRVYDQANGVLQSAGECTAVYRLLGSKKIVLPGQTVRASIVRTDRRFDLRWVKVDMRILTAYVPGQGAVAWRTRRDIRLLGVLPVTREESVVRVK